MWHNKADSKNRRDENMRIDLTFSAQEEAEFQQLLRGVMASEEAERMKEFTQHGVITTYEHCEHVARTCYKLDLATGSKADRQVLLTCAFLHDFFLYDWHEKKLANKIHGFTHPRVAARNAAKYFHLSEQEQKIIASHMWPLNIWRLPQGREAWILCLADKYCSFWETVAMRKENKIEAGY